MVENKVIEVIEIGDSSVETCDGESLKLAENVMKYVSFQKGQKYSVKIDDGMILYAKEISSNNNFSEQEYIIRQNCASNAVELAASRGESIEEVKKYFQELYNLIKNAK